ncbi:MAG: FAD-dependent oxidoreductase [Opitutaceae bacterium]|nr:FAD-dependent oxidoreductase [Opitutaceae bacterium]
MSPVNSTRPSWYRPAPVVSTDQPASETDLVIYSANAAGCAAAIQARRLGLSVAIFNPHTHVGGLTTGGLGFTDFGNKEAIGGLALEFYRRLGKHYGCETEYRFEPSAAETVLRAWLAEAGVTVHHGHYLKSVSTFQRRITGIFFTNGALARAPYFIDCSYEGDLMAAAGVTFTVGRESNSTYGETLNGQIVHINHQFNNPVDPYVIPGDPGSGLLPGIEPGRPEPGVGDHRVQAYNFRICMTQEKDNLVPFPKPENYDRQAYELLARYLATGWRETFNKHDRIRGLKTDTNNHGAVSSDYIGANYAWPTASHEEREKIFQSHVTWTQGLWWFYATDPAVPADIQAQANTWGLAKDEFTDSGHWPNQIYVREGRRMIGDVVMTENHCMSKYREDDSVGLAAYTMDSHNCRRFVDENGYVKNEGDAQKRLPKPFPVSYRSIVPAKADNVENLFVPVALSASHIAFGSIRMEPVFMVLAQSAVIAAGTARRAGNIAVQSVTYSDLRPQLESAKQVLNWDDMKVHSGGGNDHSPLGR